MYTIRKEFHFSASHILEGLVKGHPCGRLHGHNYKVVVELRSAELDEKGFVKDYGDLKPIKEHIDQVLDHQHLNDVFKREIDSMGVIRPMQPSAENIAKALFDRYKEFFRELYAIEVCETPKTMARYERG